MKKAFFVALCVISLPAIASAEVKQQPVNKLFQQALAADIAGNEQLRASLLAEVLAQDPNNKLAHWQSGQVLHNGKWTTPSKIERIVANDPRWREYRTRVESGEDSLAAHAELARWCRDQGLELESQWHWFNVLRHDIKNREALGALRMRPYRGQYFTSEQIAAYEAGEKQTERAFDKYADVLKKALREAERTTGNERSAALEKISKINDPAAVQAIVQVVLADAKNEKRVLDKLGQEKGEQLLRSAQLAAVAALAEISEHEATLRLLEVALYASDKEVRARAAQTLKHREPTSFMPLLMAGLAAPIEMSYAVNTLPNGQISVFEDFTEVGPLAKQHHSRSSQFLTQHVLTVTKDRIGVPNGGPSVPTVRSKRIGRVWSDQVRDMNNAATQLANSQNQVESENAIREQRNARIQEVLMAATGKELGPAAEDWWNDWKAHNELYTPEELPVYETEERFDYSRYAETPLYQQEYYMLPYVERPPIRTRSCFAAGTPVWTQAGMVPIEEIKIGDLVLSQNPVTGELNYRPVIDFTVRPPSATVKLSLNQESIITTRGHRFWVAGQGWQMAKGLAPGDQLVAVGGSIDLQAADTDEELEAYNLEVGEFHTYFVGENRILAHDNTCPQPTNNVLPGVSPRAEFAPQLALKN